MLRSLFAAVALVAASASAGTFSFDAATGECRDAAGTLGWNKGVVGPCGDLRELNLEKASLGAADLRGARLDGATLAGAWMLGADLRGANLSGADLTGAVLRGAKLDGARLDGARLVNVTFEGARLARASLVGADLRLACLFRASFDQAELAGARFSKSAALLEGARWNGAHVTAATDLPWTGEALVAHHLTVDVAGAVAGR